MTSLINAYHPEHLQLLTTLVTSYLESYYNDCIYQKTTLRAKNVSPDLVISQLSQWEHSASSFTNKFNDLLHIVFDNCMKLHHPCYMGHQVSAPLPLAALLDYVASTLNNGAAIFDMGPIEPIIERQLCEWVAQKIGWHPKKSGGFFTSGGSLGNLTALLVARNVKLSDVPLEKGAVIVSEQAHYSISRALKILGFSSSQIFKIPSDKQYKAIPESIPDILNEIALKELTPFLLVANACSTATGTFDRLEELGEVCRLYGLWFHVDAAHGGTAFLSEKTKHYLQGLELADSIIIDFHKMMLMPALITAVIFKDYRDSFCTFGEKASYLYANADDDHLWLDLGHRTLECTKSLMALKLYASLHIYGESLFTDYLEHCLKITQYAYTAMKNSGQFILPYLPDYNILCYKLNYKDDIWHEEVCKQLIGEASFYIVNVRLNDTIYLRSTFVNPMTKHTDIDALLERLLQIASDTPKLQNS